VKEEKKRGPSLRWLVSWIGGGKLKVFMDHHVKEKKKDPAECLLSLACQEKRESEKPVLNNFNAKSPHEEGKRKKKRRGLWAVCVPARAGRGEELNRD